MKRLIIVTMVAIVPLLSGCCGSGMWNRMTAFRGDSCNACPGEVIGAPISGPMGGPIIESGPTYYEGTILPAPALPAELPGPVDTPAT